MLCPQGLLEAIGQVADSAKTVPAQVEQGLKFVRAFEDLKSALSYTGSRGSDLNENIICRFEDIIALLVALTNTKNYAGFTAVLHMYVRTHYTKSTSKFIIAQIKDLFEGTKNLWQNKLHTQANETDMTDEEVLKENDLTPEERIAIVKDCINGWKTMRHGAFARQTCQLLNILTTFGFLDLDENPIKAGDFELFRARAWDIQKNSMDFIDVVVNTFGFFIERGYLAFAHGDPSLLLYSDEETAKFEQEYSLLVACDSLMETGRLDDLKTESINGESDFEARLDLLITRCYTMVQTEKNPHAKTVFTNRLVVLKKLRSKLIMLQKASPIRIKPFGVCTFGGSSVGKSLVNAIVTKVLLHANGFESSKRHVVTLNDSDPYQSEFRSYHNAVTMDDFGNTKASKYETSPTAKIIDFLNNVPKAALSPIAELKGNVMIRPKLVTVTTNVKRLLSNLFSNEPVSILRRFEAHLEVRLRPEFIDPETGGLNSDMVKGIFIPDAWIIDLQRIRIIRTADPEVADDYEFETILAGASIHEVLEWLRVASAKHYDQQDEFVHNTEKFYEAALCPHFTIAEQCSICSAAQEFVKELDTQAVEYIIEDDETIAPCDEGDWIDIIDLKSGVSEWYRKTGIDCAVHKVKSEVSNLKDAYMKHRDERLEALFAGAAALGLAYSAIQVFRSLRSASNALNIHGRDDGVPIVLPEDHESNWKKIEYVKLPMTHKGASIVSNEFHELIKRHLAYCTVYNYETGKCRSCNIFPIQGNTWLVPNHILWHNTQLTIEVKQGRGDTVNRRFSEIIDESKIVRFGDDWALVRLIKGGPVRDMLDCFVQDEYSFIPEPMHFVVKNQDGQINSAIIRPMQAKTFVTVAGQVAGFDYNLPTATAEGMCIAPVYTYRTPHQIVGMHCAGITGKTYGVAGQINAKMLRSALSELNEKNTLYCHSEGNFIPTKYGRDFTPTTNIPVDHAVHRMSNDEDNQPPCAEIYGAHKLGRSFFRTQVRQSPISRAVKDVMNIDRLHGPPNRENIGQHWERDLNLMAHPKGDFIPSTWMRARRDFLNKVDKFLQINPTACAATFPLAHDYVLAGADGIAAFSRIPLNTSMGWPLNKSKSGFIKTVDRVVEGISEPIDFEDPMFLEEINRIKDCLASGERIHTVFRGNLKDEPTKWTKSKIRVFAGCEVAFTCVVREFFLPIVRLIQNNWREFECAVGINAHGPQWAELTELVIKYGLHRIIAGDYTAFDKSASPEAMMSAFDILIAIARFCGYSERDLTIMRGVATEISYPIYELDGVIVQLFGSNPSGHPLTVIINNLMNSLYMRYVYFALHENEDVPPFDERISLVCYGDDNIMSVSEEEDKFSMCRIVPVLKDVGIKYTKADKTAVGEDDHFETIDDVEFLKRAFVWNPAFGNWTAALEVSSIGKSLHNQMESTTPRNEIAAQAIRSANVEFAYHGPEVFHERQPQLEEVARRSGISALVGELPTLDDIVKRYHDSRIPKSMEDEPILSVQCDEQSITSSLSEITLDSLEVPTSAEKEQYARHKLAMERLVALNRGHTKSGKRMIRCVQSFEKAFGKHDVSSLELEILAERSDFEAPYLDEDCQLRELQTRMENYGFRTIGINIPFMGDATLGEVDGLFDSGLVEGDDRVIVLVEAKMRGGRRKGLQQLGKYGLALAAAGPENVHVRTVLMTGRTLEPIGEFGTSNFKFPKELEL